MQKQTGAYIKSVIWLNASSKSSNVFARLPPDMINWMCLFSLSFILPLSLFCWLSSSLPIFQTNSKNGRTICLSCHFLILGCPNVSLYLIQMMTAYYRCWKARELYSCALPFQSMSPRQIKLLFIS